jgi:hypothetical protein
MSLYSLLGTAPPVLSYCIMHQPASAKGVDEYVATIREMDEAVRQESAALTALFEKGRKEAIARESQVLRGSLTEFLSTPMRSDNASILRIFTDAFERFDNVVAGLTPIGVTGTSEGRIIAPKMQKPLEKRLRSSGKSYLRELGFDAGPAKVDIFESVFLISGGHNLDILEHIIRDRLGIYSGAHGRHLIGAGAYTFAAYNRAGNWGAATEAAASSVEAVLFFSKPVMEYAQFREAIVAAMEEMTREMKLPGVTLWQRKLGLGRGKEFILRFACASTEQVPGIVRWLEQRKEPAFFRAALVEGGSLVVKEFLAS